MSLPCFAEKKIDLFSMSNPQASKILYEFELKDINITPEKAYEVFGFKESDVYAFFYDLNSDGENEIIGYIYAPYSWCRDGWALKILKKEKNGYKEISMVKTSLDKGFYILDTKTAGFSDLRVFPGMEEVVRIAKYNSKRQYYEYFFLIK